MLQCSGRPVAAYDSWTFSSLNSAAPSGAALFLSGADNVPQLRRSDNTQSVPIPKRQSAAFTSESASLFCFGTGEPLRRSRAPPRTTHPGDNVVGAE